MELSAAQWEKLRELRGRFLEKKTGSDYWQSRELLELYDSTVAMRIRWKWDFVLHELARRNWEPGPSETLIDFACGTAAASTRFLKQYPNAFCSIELRDRSERATAYAREKLQVFGKPISVNTRTDGTYTLLVSHAISELDEKELSRLRALAAGAENIVWVEPGDHENSRLLSRVRDHLAQSHSIVAPCPFTQGSCGVLRDGMDRHWCHFFAPSPDEIFHSRFWSRYAKEMEVDLTRLPVAFLVASRHPAKPIEGKRVLGEARLYKAEFKVLACDVEGVREIRIQKRDEPELYKLAKKAKLPSYL